MADFQNHKEEFEGPGARIVVFSSDAGQEASETARSLGLEYDVGHDLDPGHASRVIGCYPGIREGRAHVQPAGFVLGPEGTIVHAVYSSGKVGRLTASDALTIVREKLATV